MIDAAHKKLHFIWDPNKPDVCSFADKMKNAFGQAAKKDADIIVAIGGDGTAIWALDNSDGTPVFPMTVPVILSSTGFLTNHDVTGPENLITILEKTTAYDLPVLEGALTFADGRSVTHSTCAEIVIEKLRINEGATLDLKAVFNNQVLVDMPGIGSNGLIVTTALGSTGYHASNSGDPMGLDDNRIALSAVSAYSPRPFAPHIFDPGTVITITPPPRTHNKRPLGVGFGSDNDQKYSALEVGSAIAELKITTSEVKKAVLLTCRDPNENADKAKAAKFLPSIVHTP